MSLAVANGSLKYTRKADNAGADYRAGLATGDAVS
jgi:hypothetical protein